MRTDGRQRGSALTATLAVTAALLPVGAFALLLARADWYVQHNTRAQAEVFYTAEAGLEHALADIPPATKFDHLLNGPDGRLGTPDDGAFPFPDGDPGWFPREPLRYEVRVERAAATLLRLSSAGYGARNARATVEALIAPDPKPYVPAALYAANARDLAVGPDFLVSGLAHAPDDAAAEPTGTSPAVTGLGVSDDAAAAALRGTLRAAEAAHVIGAGDAPSIAGVAPVDVAALIATIAAAPGAAPVPTSTLSRAATLGSVRAPQISVLTGTEEITGPVEGAGVLIATGDLRVRGGLTFTGLVLVAGDVSFDRHSAVRVDGSLWAAGSVLTLVGRGAITYDREALTAIDRRAAALLPHAVVVTSWREVF